jgi:SAM-dependent methyltransferase
VLTWNDQPVEAIEFPISRPDVAGVFKFLPYATESGFYARLPPAFLNEPGKLLAIRWTDRRTGRPLFGRDLPYYYPVPTPNEVLPDADRRMRIHGNREIENYRIIGATAWMRLRAALKMIGQDMTDFGNVLDWGCGCGRVARYFPIAMPRALTGIDVDPDNLRWCQEHLPFADFRHVPLHPPTPLPDGAFDLVVGISVLTHLREKVQFEWLAEMNRVCRRGAFLLLTYHHHGAVCMMDLKLEQYQHYARYGFLELPHPTYDADLPEKDYYYNIFHTKKYIRKHWSRYFRIVDMIPSFIGQQDLVILRKK